jgi:hypothetical protein
MNRSDLFRGVHFSSRNWGLEIWQIVKPQYQLSLDIGEMAGSSNCKLILRLLRMLSELFITLQKNAKKNKLIGWERFFLLLPSR